MIRRSASEVLRSLETRVARLERTASRRRTAAFPDDIPSFLMERGNERSLEAYISFLPQVKEIQTLLLRSGFTFKSEDDGFLEYTYDGKRVVFHVIEFIRPNSLKEFKGFLSMKKDVLGWVDQQLSDDMFYDDIMRSLRGLMGSSPGRTLAFKLAVSLLESNGISLHD